MKHQGLSLNTFYSLVEEKTSESRKVEFKKFTFAEGKVNAEQKDKIEKEIAAFANAEGGTIFIGIDESKERVASRVVGVGCGIEKLDEIQLSIQSRLLAKVHPRIHGISISGFPLSDNDMVIAIVVPKSVSRPHAVNDGNKDNFYIRHTNGITNMSLDDLRREILSGALYQNKIINYKRDRIGMIMSNEYIRHLQEGANLILHIIPLWSMDLGNFVDVAVLNSWTGRDPFRPISGSGVHSSFCAEGRYAFSTPYDAKDVQSSVLITRTGIIEAVDVYMMNYRTEFKETFSWNEVEKTLYEKIADYAGLLEQLEVPKPWYISVCLTNGKGYWTQCSGEESEELYSNYIQGMDAIWNDGQNLKDIIKPCFDSLANAFGYPNSFLEFHSK